MATRSQNLQTAADNIAALIVTVTASANPNYTVGNRTISKADYLRQLIEDYNTLLKAAQDADGPFELCTRARAG